MLKLSKTELVTIPTKVGQFQMLAYYDSSAISSTEPTVVLVKGNVCHQSNVLVRFHSECITGEVFGSLRCDCAEQLLRAMEIIEAEGIGMIIYLRQEGRGIGLINKLRAYRLQEQGYDTVTANEALKLPIDSRDYTVCKDILDEWHVKSVRLITNNPDKVSQATQLGIEVSEVCPLEVAPNDNNRGYLYAKKQKLKHHLFYV